MQVLELVRRVCGPDALHWTTRLDVMDQMQNSEVYTNWVRSGLTREQFVQFVHRRRIKALKGEERSLTPKSTRHLSQAGEGLARTPWAICCLVCVWLVCVYLHEAHSEARLRASLSLALSLSLSLTLSLSLSLTLREITRKRKRKEEVRTERERERDRERARASERARERESVLRRAHVFSLERGRVLVDMRNLRVIDALGCDTKLK